ncbi:hypothetical protein JI721_09765 [Alicyclobacillus cycloheptanicus]|jgi:hypothetical protein|uniref:Uncharacterized protein n=1 Tax=Alicyclobacillus cycloheptanicus TaxID=1457 RepID=A0ABT9XJ13_9BACL|nr:hypothetical protein [Alicyclobacillus cycloheptanicus]MDQ0190304.1 hypothetical protein [Alicyclobacillus cycloheptanicus]WDM00048.1 hypothetical protein JI721_09765 [Alicyclobacillus cycloheptanicus]
MPSSSPAARSRLKTRIGIAIGVLVILALGAWIDIDMKNVAAARAADHQMTFAEYVHNHHLGTLVTIDDGTGLNASAYDLQLSKPVPDGQRTALALELSEVYAKDDHGELLTIDYTDPKTKLDEPIATCTLDPNLENLTVTVHFTNGQQQVVHKHVDW